MKIVSYKPNYSSAASNASYPLRQSVNSGITLGEMSMPKKFSGADNETSFSLGRAVYIKSGYVKTTNNILKKSKGVSCDSSSQYIDKLKNLAIGSGSTIINENSEHSFKSQDNTNRNTVRSALRKARSSGYVPPKKAAHNYN